MPFMRVTKEEKQLIEYIRQMTFDDVFDVGQAIVDSSREMIKESYPCSTNRNSHLLRAKRMKEFYMTFSRSNREFWELE